MGAGRGVGGSQGGSDSVCFCAASLAYCIAHKSMKGCVDVKIKEARGGGGGGGKFRGSQTVHCFYDHLPFESWGLVSMPSGKAEETKKEKKVKKINSILFN